MAKGIWVEIHVKHSSVVSGRGPPRRKSDDLKVSPTPSAPQEPRNTEQPLSVGQGLAAMHAVSCLELSWCCVTVAIGCACLATGLSFCNMPSSNARSRPRLCDRRFPWHGRLPRPVPSLLRGGGLPKRERQRRLARVRSPAIHCHNAVLRSLAVRLTISRVNLRIKKLPHRLVRAWRRTGCPPALLASVQPTGRSRRVRYKQHGTRLALRALHEEQRAPTHHPLVWVRSQGLGGRVGGISVVRCSVGWKRVF